MTVLEGKKAAKYVRDLINQDLQIQINGVDLTIGEIYKFSERGVLDFDNSNRKIPKTELVTPKNGWYDLEPGTYIVRYRESVEVPLDCIALVFPRSSLLRMGVMLHTAVYDAGYKGRGIGLLIVFNSFGIKLSKDARIGQIVFIKSEKVEKGYEGEYLGEGLREGEK